MARSKKQEVGILELPELEVGKAEIFILGRSPLIFNRMAAKARQELLFPRGRLTAADKASKMKHDPITEYRDSVTRRRNGESGPTRLLFPAPAFKGAMATAALDMPGVQKTRINRLTWITGTHADIWGIPQMFMSVVRNSDQNHTPDIRTRAIVPEWCASVEIAFVRTFLRDRVIASLIGASGLIVGIGDFRQEKGKGNFGQFEVVAEDDRRLLSLMKEGGMKAQDKALENPEFYDADTEDLFTWFQAEVARRGPDVPKPVRARRTRGNGGEQEPTTVM